MTILDARIEQIDMWQARYRSRADRYVTSQRRMTRIRIDREKIHGKEN